ncbi:MAG: redoxin domain-containing protein [Pseudohongiella sp.]|nr:redoxin domain-containing protein [Pseudohongiella sp.]MDO9519862.1 redoxin domain-containing protein [Pseudohongiella sp.]MDP2126659.1 redoxin domain-containing protein [Pseudohongiella sp.]
MKKFSMLAMFSVAAAFSFNAQAADRVGDFTLIDNTGKAHQLSKYAYSKALVIISQATGCTANQENIARYKQLRTNWDHRGVTFVMLNSDNKDDRAGIRAEEAIWNYDFPILDDETQLVAESLGITHAGQVVVVDPVRMNVLYRGPLPAQPANAPLGQALTAIVADGADSRQMETVTVESEAAAGCALTFPARDAALAKVPDYETEIAPILIERCVGCHVEGGIGPFAMNSHMMIQGWSPMIREVIMTGRMPPMQIDPTIREFTNSGNLPVEERQKLVHWINAGSPR